MAPPRKLKYIRKGRQVASLDKLSGDLVKFLEAKALEFETWAPFEAWIRELGAKVWLGDNSHGLDKGNEEELSSLAGQYDRAPDFQNEFARYAELAWGHARNNADPGPMPNAHITGTPPEGDLMQGHPDKAPWATGTETLEDRGEVLPQPATEEDVKHRNVFDRTSDKPDEKSPTVVNIHEPEQVNVEAPSSKSYE
jgi:hypothetical protein